MTLRLVILLSILSGTITFTAVAAPVCSLNQSSESLMLTAGNQTIVLQCTNPSPEILHFPRKFLNGATLETTDKVPIPSLRSADYAFYLPASDSSFLLHIDAQIDTPLTINLSAVSEYYENSMVHAVTISAFVGFCLALVVYVGVLGKSMRNYGLYSYSFYVASACAFFLLQEGLLHTLMKDGTFLESVQLKVFLAGLTIFTAVRFLDRLLDFKALLPTILRKALLLLAVIVLVLVTLQLGMSSKTSMLVNSIISHFTLIIMTGTLGGCIYAAWRKVHCASMVLIAIAIAIMVLAMLCRFYIKDYSPFLQRYALLIGLTIEALILALAASRKVKKSVMKEWWLTSRRRPIRYVKY